MKKRILSLALALVLCLGLTVHVSAAETPSVVWLPEGWRAVWQTENRVYLVTDGEHNNGVYVVVDNGNKYGLMDIAGNMIIEPQYDYIRGFSDFDGLTWFRIDNKCGYMNSAGQVVIPAEYDYAELFSEGLARVGKIDEGGDLKYGYISETGEVIVPLVYDLVRDFSEGLALVKKNDNWSFIDQTGKVALDIDFLGSDYDIYDFRRGLAAFHSGNGWGFLDKNGVVLPLEEKYNEMEIWLNASNDLIFVEDFVAEAEGWTEYDFFNDMGIWVHGYINRNGDEVIPVEYNSLSFFTDGQAVAGKYDSEADKWQWELISESGNVIAYLGDYDYVAEFSEGLAVVGRYTRGERTWKYGYIDQAGKEVVPVEYYDVDLVNGFVNGLLAVGKIDADGDLKYGCIDRTGKTAIPFEYDYIGGFADGLAVVKKGLAYGYIDQTGKAVIPVEYKYADSFLNGLAKVTTTEGVGCLNNVGETVIPLEYDIIELSLDGTVAMVLKDGRYGFIFLTGSSIFKPEYAARNEMTMKVDGKDVQFAAYGITDANGGFTNYVKLRDIAYVLNGSAAQFSVDYDNTTRTIVVETGKPYAAEGTEMKDSFGTTEPYDPSGLAIRIDGKDVPLSSFVLYDQVNGASTYIKLRDLGAALGFNVSWIDGYVVIATDEPYSDVQ